MIIKLIIDLATKEVNCDDTSVVINEVKIENGQLLIEISKPDPETTPLYTPTEPQ
jgi:hypothetical protein